MNHHPNRPSAVSWKATLTPTITIAYTVIDGCWHWRRDEPNARNSTAYPSYPEATAAAKLAHGIPAIGQSGQHITHLEETTTPTLA